MPMPDPRETMRRALRLAWRGRGRAEPNPLVGCVLLHHGEVVAAGHHRRCGGPHAEAEALARCRARGLDPAGCEVYVTLEPCAHHGRTPPCADALIDAGVARVHVAARDPSPHAAGAGIERLRAAGIPVEVGLEAERAERQNAPFFLRSREGRPWTIAKWAQTLDGRTATRTGASQWISGPASRRRVHRWRGRVDAVVVGVGTARADDPRLTPRGVPARRMPWRVVVDPDLRLPPTARMLAEGPPVVIACREGRTARAEALAAAGARIWPIPAGEAGEKLSLDALWRRLARDADASTVLVEGGARLTGSLLAAGLLDELRVFVAPLLLADEAAAPALAGRSIAELAGATPLEIERVKRVGPDTELRARFPRAAPAPGTPPR